MYAKGDGMTIRIEKNSIVEIELRDIPFKDWPEELKVEARTILSIPYFKRQFLEQLVCCRKDWIVRKIETRVALQLEWRNTLL